MKDFIQWLISESNNRWFVDGFSLMPYLKRGGPVENPKNADSLENYLEQLWNLNSGTPYFPTYISSPNGETWELPDQLKKNLITQLQEFSGGPAYPDDPSVYTSDEIEPLKKLFQRYASQMQLKRNI